MKKTNILTKDLDDIVDSFSDLVGRSHEFNQTGSSEGSEGLIPERIWRSYRVFPAENSVSTGRTSELEKYGVDVMVVGIEAEDCEWTRQIQIYGGSKNSGVDDSRQGYFDRIITDWEHTLDRQFEPEPYDSSEIPIGGKEYVWR